MVNFYIVRILTNNVTLVAINGLVGLAIAPRGWMATLPVMVYVLGYGMDPLEAIVAAAIAEAGASSAADLGKVMKLVLPKVQGRADGGQVVLPLVGALVRNAEVCGPNHTRGWVQSSSPRKPQVEPRV